MFYGQSSIYGPGPLSGVTFSNGTSSLEQSRLHTQSRIPADTTLSSMLDAHIPPAVLAAYGLGSMLNGVTRPTPLHPSTNVTPRSLPLDYKDAINPYCSWPMSWPSAGLHIPRPALTAGTAGFFNPGLWPGGLPGLVGHPPGVAAECQQRDKSPVTSVERGESPVSTRSPNIPMPPVIPSKDYPWLFHSYHPDLLK
jgi:hypothetical protein